MTALRLSLARLPELESLLGGGTAELLGEIGGEIDPLSELHDLLERAVREDAPLALREGGLIREGYHPELDELLTLLRDGETVAVSLVPRDPPPQDGAIGILMGPLYEPVSLVQALPMGVRMVYEQIAMFVTLPAALVQGSISPEMARPVGYKGMFDMYQYMSEEPSSVPSSSVNLNAIGFFAMISVSLGFINLLPIPALDGGRILFVLPEIVLGRPIPIKWQNMVNFVFFVGLIALFLYINVMDFVNPVQFP
jgi:RIP metalloprotease RseP